MLYNYVHVREQPSTAGLSDMTIYGGERSDRNECLTRDRREIFTLVECARSNFRRDAYLIILEDRLESSFNILVNGGEQFLGREQIRRLPLACSLRVLNRAIDCGSRVASSVL